MNALGVCASGGMMLTHAYTNAIGAYCSRHASSGCLSLTHAVDACCKQMLLTHAAHSSLLMDAVDGILLTACRQHVLLLWLLSLATSAAAPPAPALLKTSKSFANRVRMASHPKALAFEQIQRFKEFWPYGGQGADDGAGGSEDEWKAGEGRGKPVSVRIAIKTVSCYWDCYLFWLPGGVMLTAPVAAIAGG
eukprot:1155358-Pelagomonas_calceolata.AAC.7